MLFNELPSSRHIHHALIPLQFGQNMPFFTLTILLFQDTISDKLTIFHCLTNSFISFSEFQVSNLIWKQFVTGSRKCLVRQRPTSILHICQTATKETHTPLGFDIRMNINVCLCHL